MINIIQYPKKEEWQDIVKRPEIDQRQLFDTVQLIIDKVRDEGDYAVKVFERKFDKVDIDALAVPKQEIEQAEKLIGQQLKEAIEIAHRNIYAFHEAQLYKTKKITTCEGVTCWQKPMPIQKVGLYIPGGTAPLFSTVLMLATPAKIAGCKKIILCTPPDKNGNVNPAILFAAKTAGVTDIFKIGGVQAIAAMAYGTQTVPKVYKIFGPGNQYVMAAKQLVAINDVAIDMPAGPSEVAVVADQFANPQFVAADLLSQAEHGRDSQVILVSDSLQIIEEVEQETLRQLEALPRKEIAVEALDNSRFVLFENLNVAMDFVNEYAPEHLILNVKEYEKLAEKVENAGSVFLGQFSCESAGDYASGTNHTLPTKGYAKAYSGVSLDSFIRKITFQELSQQGVISIAKAVETMANNEQLNAHENAMRLRRIAIQNKENV